MSFIAFVAGFVLASAIWEAVLGHTTWAVTDGGLALLQGLLWLHSWWHRHGASAAR